MANSHNKRQIIEAPTKPGLDIELFQYWSLSPKHAIQNSNQITTKVSGVTSFPTSRFFSITPQKTHMSPKTGQFQKEACLPTHYFSVDTLGGVVHILYAAFLIRRCSRSFSKIPPTPQPSGQKFTQLLAGCKGSHEPEKNTLCWV